MTDRSSEERSRENDAAMERRAAAWMGGYVCGPLATHMTSFTKNELRLAALEDRQEAAPERRPPFCNYAIVPVASGGFLHCNDSSGHGGEHSWRGPWTVYENYGGVPSEAIPSKEYTQWQGDRVVAIGEKEARIWDTEILPVGWGMPKEISYTLPPVGTPQKETPTMPYGAGAQNFGAVPEGVQGKEPQTFDEFWAVKQPFDGDSPVGAKFWARKSWAAGRRSAIAEIKETVADWGRRSRDASFVEACDWCLKKCAELLERTK